MRLSMVRFITATAITPRGIGGTITTVHPTGGRQVTGRRPTGRLNRSIRSRHHRLYTRQPGRPQWLRQRDLHNLLCSLQRGQLRSRLAVLQPAPPRVHRVTWRGRCPGAGVSRSSRRAPGRSLPSTRVRCGSCSHAQRTIGRLFRRLPPRPGECLKGARIAQSRVNRHRQPG